MSTKPHVTLADTADPAPRKGLVMVTGSDTSLGNLPAFMSASALETRYWQTRAEIAKSLWHSYKDRKLLGDDSIYAHPTDSRLWAWRQMWFSEIEHQHQLCRRKIETLIQRSTKHDEEG